MIVVVPARPSIFPPSQGFSLQVKDLGQEVVGNAPTTPCAEARSRRSFISRTVAKFIAVWRISGTRRRAYFHRSTARCLALNIVDFPLNIRPV